MIDPQTTRKVDIEIAFLSESESQKKNNENCALVVRPADGQHATRGVLLVVAHGLSDALADMEIQQRVPRDRGGNRIREDLRRTRNYQ